MRRILVAAYANFCFFSFFWQRTKASITIRKLNLRDVGFNIVATAFTQQKLMSSPKVKIIIKNKFKLLEIITKETTSREWPLARSPQTISHLWKAVHFSFARIPCILLSSLFLSSDGSLAVLYDRVFSYERCITMNYDDFVVSWALERTKGWVGLCEGYNGHVQRLKGSISYIEVLSQGEKAIQDVSTN